jgi:L-cysteine:1D-myo-inositol 2-amino-2-deoxy-alpha-D-glucopyranoside ligase
MESWPAPHLPVLPGRGDTLRVYDTASGSVVETAPGQTAGLYVCGITPYDATHLGHAATYVAFDVLQRVWRDAGHAVRYVQNVTDVDDPLLERARATGADWRELAERETNLFREDMIALRVLPPDHYVGAVEAMQDIIALIERLRGRGAAYEVDGDLYFPASADPGFGSIGHLTGDEMIALSRERGGDPDRPGKKDPVDCLLWHSQRPGDPVWQSPFGPGRPGWHVECTAITLRYLGMGFDIQGGGTDLIFPHHEFGASHGQVATGNAPYAKAYVHAGMVGLGGEKMSKSKGNLVFVSTLRHDGVDPMALRLALLAHHYRSDWEWTDGAIAASVERLARWRAAVSRPDGHDAAPVLAALRDRLSDDLDCPGALAAVDEWADAQLADGSGGADAGAPGVVSRAVEALLGVAL